ncbi:MAG: MaoC family dehydratase N-terminal domain-containing protein [Coriobacteriales bacterium]|jgi:acyl dehydratase|nr:MaoC family dehydratase N-terminal domain-containing protein [Coriobacteriales bacterium]
MYLEDFQPGQHWAVPPVTVTAEQIIRFATEFDPLPIHTDPEQARASHFGGLIASGPMSFLLFLQHFNSTYPEVNAGGLVAGMNTCMEWLAPMRPDDSLQGEVEISGTEVRNDHNGAVHFAFTVRNQTGKVVLKASSKVCFLRRGDSSERPGLAQQPEQRQSQGIDRDGLAEA